MKVPMWVYQIPFVAGGREIDGADCWGLIVLLYKHFFNIDLPRYDGKGVTSKDTVVSSEEEILAVANSSNMFEEVVTPQFGDCVLVNMIGHPIPVSYTHLTLPTTPYV